MKRYWIGMALCLCLVGITACGKADAAGETENGSESEEKVSTVELWDSEKELEGELVIRATTWGEQEQFMVDQFMEEHPGVTIEVDVPDQSDYFFNTTEEAAGVMEYEKDEINKMVTELMSGSGADIYDIGSKVSFAKGMEAYFEDLYDYMEADPDIDPKDYYTNVWEACECNGHLLAMPTAFNYVYVRLNKDMLESTDVSVKEEVDYQDLLAIWRQAEEQGLVDDDTVLTKQGWIINFIYDTEEAICVDWEEKESFLDSEAFIECLDAMKGMRAEYPYYFYEYDDKKAVDENELFTAFMHCYDGYNNDLLQEGKNATRAFLFHASDGSEPFSVVSEEYGISSGSSQKALAWEFIKFCIQEKEYDFDEGENAYYNYSETFGAPINKNNARKLYEYFTDSDEETVNWLIRNDES